MARCTSAMVASCKWKRHSGSWACGAVAIKPAAKSVLVEDNAPVKSCNDTSRGTSILYEGQPWKAGWSTGANAAPFRNNSGGEVSDRNDKRDVERGSRGS